MFARGINATHMVDWFNVRVYTIRKYIDIVYDILWDKDKLFNKYIYIMFGTNYSKLLIISRISQDCLIFVELLMVLTYH